MSKEIKAGDMVTIPKKCGHWNEEGEMDYLLKGKHKVSELLSSDRASFAREGGGCWQVPLGGCVLVEGKSYELGQKIYVGRGVGEALKKKWERIFIKHGKDNSVIVVIEDDADKFQEGVEFEVIQYSCHAPIPEPTFKPMPYEEWLEFFGKPIREVGDTQVATIDILNGDSIVLSTGSTWDLEDMMDFEVYLGGKWHRLRLRVED